MQNRGRTGYTTVAVMSHIISVDDAPKFKAYRGAVFQRVVQLTGTLYGEKVVPHWQPRVPTDQPVCDEYWTALGTWPSSGFPGS